MTTEQILEKIKKERGENALRDGRQLTGLFADYSRGQLKAQQNQLDIFLKCDGNTCILNLRNASKQRQQTEYHRLIQEMVSNYGMQEKVALEISGAFWRVAIGTEPLVSNSTPETYQTPMSGSKQDSKPELLQQPVADQASNMMQTTNSPEFDITPDGVLRCYLGDSSNVTVPDGVKEIGWYAFREDKNLESVVIPRGVTDIGFGAFSRCKKLASVALPDTVHFIGSEVFEGCTSLSTIVLPGSLTTVNLNWFANCNMRSVKISSGVISLEIEQVENLSLHYLEIPDTVQLITRNTQLEANGIRQRGKTTIRASGQWIKTHQWFFQSNPDFIYEEQTTPAGEKNKEAAASKGKIPSRLFRHYYGRDETVAFLIGLCGIVLYSPAFVSGCHDTVIAGTDPSVFLLISIVPLLAIWRMCLLWKRGFGSLFSGGFLEKLDCAYSKVLMWVNVLGCFISVVGVLFALVDGWSDGVWLNIFMIASLAGLLASSAFNTIWHWEKSW